jgi:hypothetical protein
MAAIDAVLTQQQIYRELGRQYVDARDREAVQRRLVHRLEARGYMVSLQPTAPADEISGFLVCALRLAGTCERFVVAIAVVHGHLLNHMSSITCHPHDKSNVMR